MPCEGASPQRTCLPQELDTALGRLVQLVALTARYLDAPLAAALGACGSRCRVWRPRSFWSADPPAAAPPLALHVRAAPPPPPEPLPPCAPRPAGARGPRAFSSSADTVQAAESSIEAPHCDQAVSLSCILRRVLAKSLHLLNQGHFASFNLHSTSLQHIQAGACWEAGPWGCAAWRGRSWCRLHPLIGTVHGGPGGC